MALSSENRKSSILLNVCLVECMWLKTFNKTKHSTISLPFKIESMICSTDPTGTRHSIQNRDRTLSKMNVFSFFSQLVSWYVINIATANSHRWMLRWKLTFNYIEKLFSWSFQLNSISNAILFGLRGKSHNITVCVCVWTGPKIYFRFAHNSGKWKYLKSKPLIEMRRA